MDGGQEENHVSFVILVNDKLVSNWLTVQYNTPCIRKIYVHLEYLDDYTTFLNENTDARCRRHRVNLFPLLHTSK